MRRVSVKDLKGGEILAKDVCTSSLSVLMARGTILKKDYIEKLPILNIQHVYIEDRAEEAEGSNFQKNTVAQEMLRECQNRVKSVLEHHIYKQNKELEHLCTMAEELIDTILQEKEISSYMIEMKEERNDMYTHSLHVCSLATLLAFRLGMDKSLVVDIAKGGILHDIGLRYLTVPYENCEVQKLSAQEQGEYKKHAANGYKSLNQEDWLTERAKEIVLMHHEYVDGSGYPLRLTGDRIPDAVKVISICDAFDELISGIGHCHRKMQEAVEFLKYNAGRLFDKRYTEVFLRMIVYYPVGTIVKLSTGEMAKVIRQNPEFNERPVLELLCDADGRKYTKKKEMDLCKVLNVFIVNEEDGGNETRPL